VTEVCTYGFIWAVDAIVFGGISATNLLYELSGVV